MEAAECTSHIFIRAGDADSGGMRKGRETCESNKYRQANCCEDFQPPDSLCRGASNARYVRHEGT